MEDIVDLVGKKLHASNSKAFHSNLIITQFGEFINFDCLNLLSLKLRFNDEVSH